MSQRLAIFGLGRSGIAVAKAALKAGMRPEVFDEAQLDSISKAELVQECADIHVPVHLGSPSPLPLGASDGSDSDGVCDLLVVNPAIDKRHPSLKAAQEHGIEVISEIEFAYRISKAPIIAITGTNGKSTTTLMTWLILKEAGLDAILCGNIYGTGYPEIPLTQAASESTHEQVLVAEVSSFQLEWVQDFHPVCACITNITPDHLNRYEGSFEEYAETKQRIFANLSREDTAIIKAGDPVVRAPRGPIIKTFGSSGEHAFADGNILVIGDEDIETADLPFGGAHNYLNAMAAGLLATSYMDSRVPRVEESMARDAVCRGLKKFKGLEHRMEELGTTADGVTMINNSMCTNPDAVVKSCLSINRPLHILMGGENKGLDFTPMRELLSGTQNKAYIFGESKDQISAQANGDSSVHETMQDAFEHALRNAKRGDVIILAPGCASTDQFKDFRHRGDVFRTLAKEWLQSCSGP
ncbi:MAG: UDP-N-acetylmuramoyl-L-alanine--D-glutamate ligase [Fimbriimonadaceae bacterium]